MYQLFIIDIYLIDRKRKCRNIEEKKYIVSKWKFIVSIPFLLLNTRAEAHNADERTQLPHPQTIRFQCEITYSIQTTLKETKRTKNIVSIHYHKFKLGKNKQRVGVIF